MEKTINGLGVEILMRPSIDPDEQARGIKIFRSAALVTLKEKKLEEFAIARSLNYKMISHGAIEIAALIREMAFCGVAAHLPHLGIISPVVSGKCNPSDPDWESKIKISYRIRLDKHLRKQIQDESKIRIRPMVPARPELKELFRSTNRPVFSGTLDPNEGLVLTGRNLKFNPNNLEEGIFFRNMKKLADCVRAEPGFIRDRSIVFMVPVGLKKGETYQLLVRAKLFRCKDVREGVFASLITPTA